MHYPRKFLGAAAVAALVFAGAPCKPSEAAVMLDQSSLGGSFGFGAATFAVQSIGQTFAIGKNGTLDHINVELFGIAGTVDAPLVFNVLGVSGGAPDGGNILASITLTFSEASAVGMHTFDVSGDNIAVTIGQTLAFSLSSATSVGPGDYAQAGFITGYAGGQAFGNLPTGGLFGWHNPLGGPGSDMHFQTFIDANAVPEPTGLGLAGLAALLLLRRRRKASARG